MYGLPCVYSENLSYFSHLMFYNPPKFQIALKKEEKGENIFKGFDRELDRVMKLPQWNCWVHYWIQSGPNEKLYETAHGAF